MTCGGMHGLRPTHTWPVFIYLITGIFRKNTKGSMKKSCPRRVYTDQVSDVLRINMVRIPESYLLVERN